MTNPTDEELDALVERAAAAIDRVKPSGILSNNAKLSAALFALYDLLPAITSLRTQLAEALNEVFDFPDRKAMSRRIREQRKLIRKLQVESDALHKLLRGGNSRADRAEAALAAQMVGKEC